jgi:hypothetical protein
MPEPPLLPRTETEIELEEEPHQNVVGESITENSLLESAAARDVAKPPIDVQHEPVSTQLHFEAPAATFHVFRSPKTVIPCADIPRRELVSPIGT